MDQPIVETRSVIRLKYRTLWIVCLALLGILLALHVLSYFIIVPQRYILWFFLPMFLFQLLVITDYNVKSGHMNNKKRGKPLIKIHLQPWIVIIGILLFISFMAELLSMLSYAGVPEIENGQYVLNNHGQYTVIGKAVYQKAKMAEARSSSAIFMVFLYAHFGYFFCKKTRVSSIQQ